MWQNPLPGANYHTARTSLHDRRSTQGTPMRWLRVTSILDFKLGSNAVWVIVL